MKQTLMAGLLLVLFSAFQVWSPGPYPFERCTKEFNIAVKGTVTKIETAVKSGDFVLSTATLEVKKTYAGKAHESEVRFHFWTKTDQMWTLSHDLKTGQDVLVFLSDNLEDITSKDITPSEKYFLQFAKGRNQGYLFNVLKTKKGKIVSDAIFSNHFKGDLTLKAAEKLIQTNMQP